MNIRRVLALVLLSSLCVVVMAQFEKTENYLERLGHGRDSVAARQFYADYVNTFRVQDWHACYRPWKELMRLAPYATYNLTHTGGGGYLLTELMKQEDDTVQRYVYFKDLMMMDDFRINHRTALNSIPKDGGETRIPLTQGSVLMWKAHHYHTLGQQHIPESVYKKDSAYYYFVDAFNQIKNENVGAENEIEPNYLVEYFETCRDLFQTDEEKYMEQFLTDYTSCLEACDKMMAVYGNGVDSLRWGYYAGARNNIQFYFQETDAGNKDNVIAYYQDRIKENKKNYPYLKNAVHLMTMNGCIGSDVYYDACEASYFIQPDFENSIGMGLLSKGDGDKQGAMQYFDEAVNKASTAGEKYLATRFKAEAIASTPPPNSANYLGYDNLTVSEKNELQRQWQGEQMGAAECYNQALQFASEAAIPGQDLADVYYKMADAYRKGQSFDNAKQSLALVRQAYPLYPAEKLTSLQDAIERAQQVAETRRKNEMAKLANEKARQEWERRQAAILAKQKAEADFWKKK